MSAGTLEKIDNKLDELDPESLRARVLKSLRSFRSSWVTLGELLTTTAYGGDYKEWGYEDFEVYCARELGLKKPTVKKLMVSYNYMKSYEPDRLKKKEINPEEPGEPYHGYDVPDYQTVELLKKARERDDLEEDAKRELHRMAFEGVSDEGALRKEIRQRLRADNPNDGAIDEANMTRRRELDSMLRMARNLRQKVAGSQYVPQGVKDRIEEALLELEALD